MNFKKFTLADGTTDCFVNLDQVIVAKPDENGTTILQTPFMAVTVDSRQFEETISKTEASTPPVTGCFNRLIQAIDRLSVRIPSSIRLHM